MQLYYVYRENASNIEMVGIAAYIDIVGNGVNMHFVGYFFKCEMTSDIVMV